MSNLHKDLTDAQIHVPKGFAGAANNTKLTKDSSGALIWAVDDHPSDNVTKIIAGTNVTISPTTGLGDVTINSTGGGGASHSVHSLRGCFSYEGAPKGGKGGSTTNWYCRGLRCGEVHDYNELGFTMNLGGGAPAPITPIPTQIPMGGSLHWVDSPNPDLYSYQGMVYSDEAVICEIGFAVWKPNCEEPTEGSELIIDPATITAFPIDKNKYTCFIINPAAYSFVNTDIIVPIIRCTSELPANLIVNSTLRLIQS